MNKTNKMLIVFWDNLKGEKAEFERFFRLYTEGSLFSIL